MEKNGVLLQHPDLRLFDENRRKATAEHLAVYWGKYVAWSPDGTAILAAGDTRQEVDERLEAMGIHFGQVVHDYIDPPLD